MSTNKRLSKLPNKVTLKPKLDINGHTPEQVAEIRKSLKEFEKAEKEGNIIVFNDVKEMFKWLGL